jgi:putative Holliday junction resolvase
MAVIMALDVGEKTIGVAVSDAGETYAFPVTIIQRREGHRRDMEALRKVIAEREVGEIVVGLPLMMDGTRGIQVEKVERFVETLKRFVSLPIHLHDERLSTWDVEQVLIARGKKREDRKKVIDMLAAGAILESFMNERKTRANG